MIVRLADFFLSLRSFESKSYKMQISDDSRFGDNPLIRPLLADFVGMSGVLGPTQNIFGATPPDGVIVRLVDFSLSVRSFESKTENLQISLDYRFDDNPLIKMLLTDFVDIPGVLGPTQDIFGTPSPDGVFVRLADF